MPAGFNIFFDSLLTSEWERLEYGLSLSAEVYADSVGPFLFFGNQKIGQENSFEQKKEVSAFEKSRSGGYWPSDGERGED